jgi:hypothetical protein
MRTIKKYWIAIILISYALNSFAQQQTTLNRKLHEARVSMSTEPGRLEGILYEIKDSSILISDARTRNQYLSGNFNVTEIDFRNLDFLHVRGQNSKKKGAWIGGGITAVLSIAAIQSIFKDVPEVRNIFLLVGVPSMSIAGAGIGFLVGMIPAHISIQGSFENFDWHRSSMQRRSLVRSHIIPDYEHRNFFGWVIGPSFPVGEFGKSSGNNNSVIAASGYSSDLNFGLKLSPKLTISLSGFYNQYDVSGGDKGYYWLVGGGAIGPVFEIPITDNFSVDLKPRIGILEAQLIMAEANAATTGSGIAVNPGASLKYNIARRWVIITKAEYIYSSPKGLDFNNIQTFNLGFGAGYRFR